MVNVLLCQEQNRDFGFLRNGANSHVRLRRKENLPARSLALSVLQLYGGKSLQFTAPRQIAPVAELVPVSPLPLHATSAGAQTESSWRSCSFIVRGRNIKSLLDCVVAYEAQRN